MRPADSALGIFRNPDLCLPENPELITGCERLSFQHCQYTDSLNLYITFPEIFRSAIIGNYDCEKGLFFYNG